MENTLIKPKNDYEALLLALKLSLIAPSEKETKNLVDDALIFAKNLNSIEVEKAKKEAEKFFKTYNSSLKKIEKAYKFYGLKK